MPDTDLTFSPSAPHSDSGVSLPPLELVADEGDDGTGLDHGGFRWPMPPFAAYPPASPQTESEPCQIEGLNGRTMAGRLSFFVPQEGVAHVQMPQARTTMPLHFNQFRSLRLTRPVLPLGHKPGSSEALDDCLITPYRVTVQGDTVLEGLTVGHVETPFGVFLFPPEGDEGAVTRLFVPHEVLKEADFGVPRGPGFMDTEALAGDELKHEVELEAIRRKEKLSEVLQNQLVVTREQLLAAIDKQSNMPMVRIGEALIAMDLIEADQLEAALERQRQDRTVPLGELLVQMGLVSHDQLLLALARKMGYPLVDLSKFPIDPGALTKLAYNVASRLKVVPLMLRSGALIVAIDDPSKRLVLSEIEFIAQCKVVPVLAQATQLDTMIKESYHRMGADVWDSPFAQAPDSSAMDLEPMTSGKLIEDLEKENDRASHDDDRPIEQSDNSLVRLINTMIIEAFAQGVSDIHIESYPGREKIKIRFRKDGVLVPYLELPHNYRSAMIARIKIMCDLDISERRRPQDGKINFARFVPQYRLELRVATVPTNNGLEDVVMRILSSARPLPLDQIGLSPHNLQRLTDAMERSYGMILCVGPTGSGKTTTLHSALSFINVPERKIWTAEDPVEITQPGLRQVQVNTKIDWTFAKALRAFLRADPDVIMVGEMRDVETAGIAVEASLTGHLVLSTLHTNSAPETVTRLLDMGMDPFNFADSLLVVLAQRLVRCLCTRCRVAEPASDAYLDELARDYLFAFGKDGTDLTVNDVRANWVQRFGEQGALMTYHSKGCGHCNQTGYQGRAGIHELMSISRDLRRLIQTGARSEELQRQAMREGMRTLRQDGIDKVLAGLTSLEEVRATSNV
jgi:type II secretory ATPase GspE/PulE/Tfp pilus assembly ATPase PilB-like protein